MNTITMIGRLTRDPEPVTTTNGTEICNLRIAVDRRKRDDGAVFVDVKAFNGLANSSAEYLEKGRQVAVTGPLELDEWTTENDEKRSRHYVIANQIGLDRSERRLADVRRASSLALRRQAERVAHGAVAPNSLAARLRAAERRVTEVCALILDLATGNAWRPVELEPEESAVTSSVSAASRSTTARSGSFRRVGGCELLCPSVLRHRPAAERADCHVRLAGGVGAWD